MTRSAASPILRESYLPGVPVRRGKVRDVYDLGDRLLLVASDRISAFDWVLPGGIPDKGRLLTQLSAFWFGLLGVPHHLVSLDPEDAGLPDDADTGPLVGRSMVVRKTRVVPIECVVRGYLAGSGWKEYSADGTVCGEPLPADLEQCARLPTPLFTPATKAEAGHDENISFARMQQLVGGPLAAELRSRSVAAYQRGAEHAAARGLIVADTKFEWGQTADGVLLLVDEALTPDSSRFWPADRYAAGRDQPSFDKQPVRDWLETSGWDKQSPPPPLPAEVVAATRARYVEAFERLTGERFS